MQESEVRQVNIGTPYTKYLDYDDVFIHRFRSFGLWNTTSDALVRDTEVLRVGYRRFTLGVTPGDGGHSTLAIPGRMLWDWTNQA